MGMPVTVQVVDEAAETDALDRVFEDFGLLDRTFSPFLETGEVSRIDRGELSPEGASDLMSQVMKLCRQYGRSVRGC
jgi:FAD:protein FMN transferase